jgi:hypothetical protein
MISESFVPDSAVGPPRRAAPDTDYQNGPNVRLNGETSKV